MDGHATNVAMARLLGCQMSLDCISQYKPYFIHSSADYTTYVMFDPCHMIKLMRNLLQSYKDLQSEDGAISYKYIQLLHQIQELCGLRLANKLTPLHIDSSAQKMKVSLAVQTLSSSVAEAVQTLRLMGMEQFLRSEPTENFLKVNFLTTGQNSPLLIYIDCFILDCRQVV